MKTVKKKIKDGIFLTAVLKLMLNYKKECLVFKEDPEQEMVK
jgi:hypothetical protein